MKKEAPWLQSLLMTLLWLFPLLALLWVWLSPLAFIPVPWPDDSAFYFVGRDLFNWPPRWVMIPQAPFEPTYRIFNFNTMPLYPILLGLGRFIGIDGSWGIKFWPLGFWALTALVTGFSLKRAGLHAAQALLIVACLSLDPTLRWASVLVRPESLIGLLGTILVLGLALGWVHVLPRRLRALGRCSTFWDPVSFCLALAALAHFNAVHLLFPVVIVFAGQWRRLVSIALKTLLYLSPWLLLVLSKLGLFIHQMTLQWTRLAVPNPWLSNPQSAVLGLFQQLGSPEAWPDILQWVGVLIWILVFASILLPWFKSLRLQLAGASAWIIGSIWLFNSKPEVWFVFYVHLAVWIFAGLTLLSLKNKRTFHWRLLRHSLTAVCLVCAVIFFGVGISQHQSLAKSASWRWDSYHSYVDCIDRVLSRYEQSLQAANATQAGVFKVWDPTFPDVTIELARRHPHWELTRTNDFMERSHLAIKHGFEADAVVITETLNYQERVIDAPLVEHPEVRSVWMNWSGYFLNQLEKSPNWKPQRHLCQLGRWQAFIYMNAPLSASTPSAVPATH